MPVLLHINKTGGGSMRTALRKVRRTHDIIFVGHTITARETDDLLLFTVRDPLTRFVSGFNGRLHRANGAPWLPEEEPAFARYANPNALAEALYSETAARQAMGNIAHLRKDQHMWFPAPAIEWLSTNFRPRVLWVGFTETLPADFERLKERLALPPATALPVVHRAPDGSDTYLSEKARENLSRWYAEDIRLVNWLRQANSAAG